MKKRKKGMSTFRKFTVVFFITIGILGLPLPLIPGVFFIALGISLLEIDVVREKVKLIKKRIEKNNINNQSSYILKLYLIPLEWMMLFEQRKIKNRIKKLKKKKNNEKKKSKK